MKRNLILATMTALLALGTNEHQAAAWEVATCGPDLIPVVLTGTPNQTEYPIPNCSKCRKVKVERQQTAAGDTQAVLGLTYHDEQQGVLVGSIELTVVLPDGMEEFVVIEGVSLTEGEPAQWVIADGSTWSWRDAETVWLELVRE